jgi:hypothetical protein
MRWGCGSRCSDIRTCTSCPLSRRDRGGVAWWGGPVVGILVRGRMLNLKGAMLMHTYSFYQPLSFRATTRHLLVFLRRFLPVTSDIQFPHFPAVSLIRAIRVYSWFKSFRYHATAVLCVGPNGSVAAFLLPLPVGEGWGEGSPARLPLVAAKGRARLFRVISCGSCALCGEEEIWPQESQDAQKKNVL